MNTYKINVINQSSSDKAFWCFLDAPDSSVSSEVFANSSAYQTIPRYRPGLSNSFTIPLQYSLQVGATNKAVGLGIQINAAQKQNVSLEDVWKASYDPTTRATPSLTKVSTTANPEELNSITNEYRKGDEGNNQWYGNMTFGVESEQGFIGLTWSPDPITTYQIRPNLKFYISTGSFSPNELANITSVSSYAAAVTESSFDSSYECTVTLNDNGTWTVQPGAPSSYLVMANNFSFLGNILEAHRDLASAHSSLVNMLACNCQQEDEQPPYAALPPQEQDMVCTSTGVIIEDVDAQEQGLNPMNPWLIGKVSVKCMIGFSFAYMFSSGIKLDITKTTRNPQGGSIINFSYDGSVGADRVERAFKAGKEVSFEKK